MRSRQTKVAPRARSPSLDCASFSDEAVSLDGGARFCRQGQASIRESEVTESGHGQETGPSIIRTVA